MVAENPGPQGLPIPPVGPPYSTAPPAYARPGPAEPAFGAVASAARHADETALSNVTWAAILALVGAGVSLLVLLELHSLSFPSFWPTRMPRAPAPHLPDPSYVVAVLAVSVVASLLELAFYHRAFRALAPHDARFASTAKMVVWAAVGLVVVAVAAGLLLGQIYRLIQCAGAGNSIPAGCLDLGALLGLIGLVGIGGIVALIGYIGLLIGIWRLGDRYGQEMFQAGAVLLIFPLLSVVGVLLILVAARSARGTLAAAARNQR